MCDLHRPRYSRWKAAPTTVAALGLGLALLLLAASVPSLSELRLAVGVGRGGRPHVPGAVRARAAEAAHAMARAEAFLRRERERTGVLAEGDAAGDQSGLLGAEVTPLMTTIGSLEAKRLSTNPEWARVLTERLSARGIGRGDLVAASFSGSFPGLNLALAAACQALGADLVAVSSVTASTWGANQPGFTWPEMEARLVEAGIIARVSVAVTAGGDADIAADLDADGRTLASAIRDTAARRLGVPALRPVGFEDAVERRLTAYRRAANGRRLTLYANVGGADASIGRSPTFLRLRSGFLPAAPFGERQEQGVTARLAGEGVPILVLLNVRDLALRWGVPLSSR